MKSRMLWFILSIWVMMGAISLHAQDTLVLSGMAEIPAGVMAARILSEAYGRMGIEVEAISLPVARSQYAANAGEVDGELFRSVENMSQFPNLIRIPVVLAVDQIVVFTAGAAEFNVDGWGSLQPYSIGAIIGIQEVETHTKGMRVEFVSSPEQLFKKLVAGRNDVAVSSRGIGLLAIKNMKLQGIRMLAPSLTTDALYHCLHKKHEALVPEITAVLAQMEREGRIESLRKQVENELFGASR